MPSCVSRGLRTSPAADQGPFSGGESIKTQLPKVKSSFARLPTEQSFLPDHAPVQRTTAKSAGRFLTARSLERSAETVHRTAHQSRDSQITGRNARALQPPESTPTKSTPAVEAAGVLSHDPHSAIQAHKAKARSLHNRAFAAGTPLLAICRTSAVSADA